MRTSRVFIHPDHVPLVNERLPLTDDQSHHLLKVLRCRAGDTVHLFDGAGRSWVATLAPEGRRTCYAHINSELPPVPKPWPLVACMALLKGDALDRAVQKCTEIGTTAIVLLDTEFTSVARDDAQRGRRLEHLNRIVSSACEQSGAGWRPGLTGPSSLREALTGDLLVSSRQKIVLHPKGDPLPITLPRLPTALFTGPEGGWSDVELSDLAAAGARVFRLGSQVLRAETAPLAGLVAIRHGWGWID